MKQQQTSEKLSTARRIYDYLHDNGIKQGFVAHEIGMHPVVFNQILLEKRRILAEEYFLICEALGVDYGRFRNDPKSA